MTDSVLIFFGAILALMILKLLFSKNNACEQPYKYALNKTLFTPAERSFLGVLDLAVADQYRVFGKVRVADILLPVKGLNKSHCMPDSMPYAQSDLPKDNGMGLLRGKAP